MHIQLKRPLAFIDLETTGTNISLDRIVEIAIVKIMPDGSKSIKRKLVNPCIPIPPLVTNLHGITDEMVANAPTFKEIAHEILQFLDKCDIGGYNSNRFDIPMLTEELLRMGLDLDVKERKMIDVQKIFYAMEPRTLSAAYKFYCDKTLEDAHSAEADADATWQVLDAQLQRYTHIGTTVEDIVKFTGEDDIIDFARRFVKVEGAIVFNFGRYRGRKVAEVLKQDRSYYDWMMERDFTLDTKRRLSEIYKKTMLSTKFKV